MRLRTRCFFPSASIAGAAWPRAATRRTVSRQAIVGLTLALTLPGSLHAQTPAAARLVPNLPNNIERPLRYRPEGGDFVIENGTEYFNRPLYGGNTAFRVDAGDKPEFSLYLPGRGGVLRLGVEVPTAVAKVGRVVPNGPRRPRRGRPTAAESASAEAKWLDAAETIVARYRPGEMRYEIRDPLLGPGGVLRLVAIALDQTDGLIVRAEYSAAGGPAAGAAPLPVPGRPVHPTPAERQAVPLQLVVAYGGVNGERGRRDGDIGTEAVPIGEYFQLRPEFCRADQFELGPRGFTLHSPAATMVGVMPAGAQLDVADAKRWPSASALFGGTASGLRNADGGQAAASGSAARTEPGPPPEWPVVTGRVSLRPGTPVFFSLQRIGAVGAAGAGEIKTYREVSAPRVGAVPGYGLPPAYHPDELPAVFAAAEAHFAALRGRVSVDTPDPYLDAAVGALDVAADAVWDGPTDLIMHGAIAWRTPLVGWRGPYLLDALGWHERAERYLTYWAARQNTAPVPAKIAPADEAANLARNEAALHGNGDLSDSHYDMNLVYMAVLFRHLSWTGDLGLARRLWPVIERHLAWERRLFRREFGPDHLPLYEAYADIWASDDLEYDGGGVAYASADNYFDNVRAARLARLLGRDPEPYDREAALIARAMREYLWQPDRGMFAENKDLLGRQLVHPSAGLWTFYGVIDSGLPTPDEVRAMAHYPEAFLPQLPVRGPDVPADGAYHVLATTDWMPYSWSVNNVVFGENLHAALAYWEAGRPGEAYRLMKSALLASMFMGVCPGNVGTTNYLDVYRRESQRDFADGGGVMARAVVEGLFGVRPDLLAGKLSIVPGFPDSWDHARLQHPDLDLDWRRAGDAETYVIESRFGRPLDLDLNLPARRPGAVVTVDGRHAEWTRREYDAGRPQIEIRSRLESRTKISVVWQGGANAGVADDHLRHAGSGDPALHRPDSAGPSLPTASRGFDWRAPLPASAALETVDLAPDFNDCVTNLFRHEYRAPRSPYCSLAIPKQGIGGWAGGVHATADIDDLGLRTVAAAHGGRFVLPDGVPFVTPGPGTAANVIFTSQWDNFPHEATVPLSGRARRVFLLMAGSTNWMQSRLDNGEVAVTYADGRTARLALRNPTNWWPIDQDYFIDEYQFRRPGPIPPRVDLRTGLVRFPELPAFYGRGGRIPGGAATVLELPLDPGRDLRSLTVRTLANEVVIGLMAATLER